LLGSPDNHLDGALTHFEHPGDGYLPVAFSPVFQNFFIPFCFRSVCHSFTFEYIITLIGNLSIPFLNIFYENEKRETSVFFHVILKYVNSTGRQDEAINAGKNKREDIILGDGDSHYRGLPLSGGAGVQLDIKRKSPPSP